MENVICVDEHDRVVGEQEKLLAHQLGTLHRAFSVLLFNSSGDFLIQQRAMSKYHSGGLWTNACCSHPKPGEHLSDATARRLKEELLLDDAELPQLTSIGHFIYKTALDNSLIEHELDHVFVGRLDSLPAINDMEAMGYRYISKYALQEEIKEDPSAFTFWFKEIISQFCTSIEEYIDESLPKRNL